MPRYQYVILTEAAPGRQAEFEKWYDEQHLGDVCKVPGVVGATRYKIQKLMSPIADGPAWTSLAIYEIDADDPDAVLAAIQARAGTAEMPLTDAMQVAPTMQILAAPAKA